MADLPGELTVHIAESEEKTALRMQEYVALLDYTARLSDRRQSVNNYFAGINTIFLTAFGYLLLTLPLQPWWPVILFTALGLAAVFVNIGWQRLIRRYRNLLRIRFAYLRALEAYFEGKNKQNALKITIQGSNPENLPEVKEIKQPGQPSEIEVTTLGIHQLENYSNLFKHKISFSSIEENITVVFFIAYIGVTLFAVGATILNALGANLSPIIK